MIQAQQMPVKNSMRFARGLAHGHATYTIIYIQCFVHITKGKFTALGALLLY